MKVEKYCKNFLLKVNSDVVESIYSYDPIDLKMSLQKNLISALNSFFYSIYLCDLMVKIFDILKLENKRIHI